MARPGSHQVRILPGLMGCGLNFANLEHFWVEPAQLLLKGFGPFRLAPNGIDPGPPDGQALLPTTPDTDAFLRPYYDAALKDLTTNLPRDGTWAFPGYMVYDWRKSMAGTGAALAATIVTSVESGFASDYTLVAHSQGGIVARVIWYTLAQQRKQDYIRRIITLGTPHFGSDAIVLSMLGASTQIKETASYLRFAPWLPTGTGQQGLTWLANVCCTFPGFYELFPQKYSPIFDQRKNWSLLWDPKQYGPDINISAAFLQAALAFQDILNVPSNIPPPDVMVCVTCDNYVTKFDVNPRLVLEGSVYATKDIEGDGTVADLEQLIPTGPSAARDDMQHSAMARLAGESGLLSYLAYRWTSPIQPVYAVPDFAEPTRRVVAAPDFMVPWTPGNVPLSIKPDTGFNWARFFHDP